jgi:hypothetical protein
MRGVIAQVTEGRLVAISLMAGYTVIQILDGHKVSPGDVLNGDLENPGTRTLRNEATHEDVEVVVGDFCCTLGHARRVMAQWVGTGSGALAEC